MKKLLFLALFSCSVLSAMSSDADVGPEADLGELAALIPALPSPATADDQEAVNALKAIAIPISKGEHIADHLWGIKEFQVQKTAKKTKDPFKNQVFAALKTLNTKNKALATSGGKITPPASPTKPVPAPAAKKGGPVPPPPPVSPKSPLKPISPVHHPAHTTVTASTSHLTTLAEALKTLSTHVGASHGGHTPPPPPHHVTPPVTGATGGTFDADGEYATILKQKIQDNLPNMISDREKPGQDPKNAITAAEKTLKTKITFQGAAKSYLRTLAEWELATKLRDFMQAHADDEEQTAPTKDLVIKQVLSPKDEAYKKTTLQGLQSIYPTLPAKAAGKTLVVSGPSAKIAAFKQLNMLITELQKGYTMIKALQFVGLFDATKKLDDLNADDNAALTTLCQTFNTIKKTNGETLIKDLC